MAWNRKRNSIPKGGPAAAVALAEKFAVAVEANRNLAQSWD
jgi:hypothetical protein